MEKKISKKKIEVEIKKDIKKEKKTVKVTLKEKTKEIKPPKPKHKEPVVEEKYVERLDFKDLVVERKEDVKSLLIKPKKIVEQTIIIEKFIKLNYQYNKSFATHD